MRLILNMQDANATCEINLYLFVGPRLFEEKYSLPHLLWYSLSYCSLISISDNNSFQFILKCFGKAYLNCAINEHLSVEETYLRIRETASIIHILYGYILIKPSNYIFDCPF